MDLEISNGFQWISLYDDYVLDGEKVISLSDENDEVFGIVWNHNLGRYFLFWKDSKYFTMPSVNNNVLNAILLHSVASWPKELAPRPVTWPEFKHVQTSMLRECLDATKTLPSLKGKQKPLLTAFKESKQYIQDSWERKNANLTESYKKMVSPATKPSEKEKSKSSTPILGESPSLTSDSFSNSNFPGHLLVNFMDSLKSWANLDNRCLKECLYYIHKHHLDNFTIFQRKVFTNLLGVYQRACTIKPKGPLNISNSTRTKAIKLCFQNRNLILNSTQSIPLTGHVLPPPEAPMKTGDGAGSEVNSSNNNSSSSISHSNDKYSLKKSESITNESEFQASTGISMLKKDVLDSKSLKLCIEKAIDKEISKIIEVSVHTEMQKVVNMAVESIMTTMMTMGQSEPTKPFNVPIVKEIAEIVRQTVMKTAKEKGIQLATKCYNNDNNNNNNTSINTMSDNVVKLVEGTIDPSFFEPIRNLMSDNIDQTKLLKQLQNNFTSTTSNETKDSEKRSSSETCRSLFIGEAMVDDIPDCLDKVYTMLFCPDHVKLNEELRNILQDVYNIYQDKCYEMTELQALNLVKNLLAIQNPSRKMVDFSDDEMDEDESAPLTIDSKRLLDVNPDCNFAVFPVCLLSAVFIHLDSETLYEASKACQAFRFVGSHVARDVIPSEFRLSASDDSNNTKISTNITTPAVSNNKKKNSNNNNKKKNSNNNNNNNNSNNSKSMSFLPKDSPLNNLGGGTALHAAATNGSCEIVETLLNYDANPNITDSLLRTPLHWSALNNHAKAVKVLLRGGANSQLKDKQGLTALDLAKMNGHGNIVMMLKQDLESSKNEATARHVANAIKHVTGYYDSLSNLETELKSFAKSEGHSDKIISQVAIMKANRSDLDSAIRRKHGGYQSVSKKLGLEFKK